MLNYGIASALVLVPPPLFQWTMYDKSVVIAIQNPHAQEFLWENPSKNPIGYMNCTLLCICGLILMHGGCAEKIERLVVILSMTKKKSTLESRIYLCFSNSRLPRRGKGEWLSRQIFEHSTILLSP